MATAGIDWSDIGVIVSLALNVGVALVGATWGISRVESKITTATQTVIECHRKKFDDEIDVIKNQFGETIIALRQRISDVELWNRDNFVRKESFSSVIDSMKSDVNGLGDRIEARLLRMEGKLDRNI